MTRQKYTPAEIARLGGLTAAHNMTPEQRSERARKGGQAVMEKYGKAHMLRLRLNQRQSPDGNPGLAKSNQWNGHLEDNTPNDD